MTPLRAALVFALLAFSGCGSERPSRAPTLPPPPPPLPEPLPRPEPEQDPDGIPISFGGVLPRPGTVLALPPGTEFVVRVMVEDELPFFYRGDNWEGVQVVVQTDAPPEILSVPRQVAVSDWRQPGVVTIRALESGSPTASRETYSIRLQPPFGGFPDLGMYTFRLEAEPIRVRIAEAGAVEETDCGRLSLGAGTVRSGNGGTAGMNWFGDVGGEFRSAELRLRSPAGNAELRLLSDYQQPSYGNFGDAYNLFPVMFAFDLDLEVRGAGFDQTLSLAWFDELRLRATLPGCAPIELRCANRGGCRTR